MKELSHNKNESLNVAPYEESVSTKDTLTSKILNLNIDETNVKYLLRSTNNNNMGNVNHYEQPYK